MTFHAPRANGDRQSSAAAEEVEVAIVGSGFSGLGMAIRLQQEGHHDYVVLERGADVGGTWRDNTYPGCQCDVPSHLYSFSFAPNPDWSRTYPLQLELQRYLRDCAEHQRVLDHVRLCCEVTGASWDDSSQRWEIQTSSGPLSARVLVDGGGPLSQPAVPDIPGLGRFAGKLFHSAAWDHEHDLAGERVAVIGTGASAIQFIPRIQPKVGELHLFQRTPPWILPHPDRPISRVERRLYRWLPVLQRAVRAAVYWSRETFVLGFVAEQRLMRAPELLARAHLRRQVPDRVLRRRLRPRYRIGCKRILLSNDYYPAITRPNVELVTDGISEVREHALVDGAGVEREVDTIVLATGFHVTDNPAAEHVRGRDGRSLAQVWQGSPRAYLGSAIAGFPNLFMLIGPNTGLGHSSMVYMIESQLTYVLDCLEHMQRLQIGSIEVRSEVMDAYNAKLDRGLSGTVWASGCASWYYDATGRNATLWPGFTWQFRRATRRFDATAYRTSPTTVVAPAEHPVAAAPA
ncbi:MAG: flavin-containing monooxygenase [Solirubrobacteraceae bacterium]|nr:MAG: 4-hydroxyacetophenone monooxygenase [Solirubrobacterales bacterium]